MNSFVLSGQRAAAGIDVGDRGLAYGDGLFESMRFDGARLPLWSWHSARLANGCARLAIETPDLDSIHTGLLAVLPPGLAAKVKLIVTRGVGSGGYPITPGAAPTVLAQWQPLSDSGGARGLRVAVLEVQLAAQPLLAGLKHLNRLEQVLAQLECARTGLDEGLLCDPSSHVICAIAANVFAVVDGVLLTPPIKDCGVAGVARQVLLDDPTLGVQIAPLSLATVARAQEIFLTNAVRGARPVSRCASRELAPGAGLVAARAALAAQGLRSMA